jgi:hypothetical protein
VLAAGANLLLPDMRQRCPAGEGKRTDLPDGVFLIPLSSPFQKNISLFQKPKSVVMFAPSRPHKRGGSRSSRTLRRDAVDALATQDERRLKRTAKACGPGAPTLALSWR